MHWKSKNCIFCGLKIYSLIYFREKRPKLRFRLKSGMSGEGGEDMGRLAGERHKLVHYQQVRMRKHRECNKLPFTRNTTGTVASPVSSWSSPTGTGDWIGWWEPKNGTSHFCRTSILNIGWWEYFSSLKTFLQDLHPEQLVKLPTARGFRGEHLDDWSLLHSLQVKIYQHGDIWYLLVFLDHIFRLEKGNELVSWQ